MTTYSSRQLRSVFQKAFLDFSPTSAPCPWPDMALITLNCNWHMNTSGASLAAQTVKKLPAMQETLVWFLGWKDPLEEGMAIHSSILACPTLCDPMDRSPPGSSVHGILQARTLEWIAISFSRGIFPTQGSNPGLLHCRQTLYPLSHQGSLIYYRCSSNLKCYIMTIGPTNQATQWWE